MSTFRDLLFRHGGGSEWEGTPPLTLTGATSAPATDYKLYGNTVYGGVIPDEYTQLEYATFSQAYIDTGIYLNSQTKVEATYSISNTRSGGQAIIGGRTSGTSNAYVVFAELSGKTRYNYNNQNTTGLYTVSTNTVHTLVKEAEKNYFDNQTDTANNAVDFTCEYTAYIGAINNGGSASILSYYVNIYSLKIYNGDVGELTQNYIPVKRNSDNEVGLYDLVSQQFLAKTSGTESIIAGPAFIPQPTPEAPVELLSVGDPILPSVYKIPINVSSVNLFNSATVETGYLKPDGSTSDNNWSHSDYIPITGGEQYSLKLTTYGNLPSTCWYDSNKTLLNSSSQSALLTAPAGARYVRISVKNTDLAMAMFVKGTTAPESYIPYYNTTTNIYLDEPLRQVKNTEGTVHYTDYIDYGNQKVVRQVGVYTASSSDTWVTSSGSTGNTYARVDFSDSYNLNTETELLCNYYATGRRGVTTTNNTVCVKTTRNGFLFIDNTNATDLVTWKAFVDACVTAGTPIEVYYPLATATETSVTLPSITLASGAIISVDTTVNASNLWIKQ